MAAVLPRRRGASPRRVPPCLQRTHSTSSDRSTLFLTLDADTQLEESFEFPDDGGVRLRGNVSIGSSGLTVNNRTFPTKVAYEDLEIGEVIGKGSTGAVMEALHKPTGRKLALKVINMFDKSCRAQLIREISTLYHTRCPSLIDFFGAFYREGCITVALEMMDGGALSNVLHQVGPIPERPLANMVYQILWALAYLKHERRVHRDIKPSNLLINSLGHVKVSDFGISAELQNSLAMCATFVGTFKYMSPERIRNLPYNYTSDMWSLGLTLIECATGKYPYPDSRNCIDMIQSITESEPPVLPSDGGYTLELQAFLSHMLKKEPRRRRAPEQLLEDPWLKRFGATDIYTAQANTKDWIDHGLTEVPRFA